MAATRGAPTRSPSSGWMTVSAAGKPEGASGVLEEVPEDRPSRPRP
jgi:hypothetical protein